MIHKYKLGDYNIVLDVNSGGVHVVDELTYDMLDNVAPPFAPECPEEVVTKLSRFYDPEEVRSCYAEILEAYQEGILFSPDDYEKYANFAVASPIKAMCLNIAHDCNLRCKYCFASTGDFGEGRKLMSYETGKKAVDFLLQNSGDRVNLEMDFFGGEPLMNFGSALLRAVGDTKRPLYFLLCAGVINVVLNLIFVVGFHLDVMGVAIATVISETVSALLVLRCLMKESGGIHLELRALHIHRKKMIQILRIGLPAGFQGVVFALSNVVIQSSVNIFGNIVVAGNSAAANLEGFVYMAMNAFYQTTLSFVSQNYGAGEQKRIHRIVLLGEACVIVTGTLLGNAVVFFGNELLHIYSSNPEVIAAGIVRLHYISMVYALCGIMDVMVGALRGIGYSVMPMIVSIVGVCVLRLVWLATVFQIPEYHRIETVYLSYPVTWILTSLVYIVFFIWVRVRTCRKSAAA